MKGLVLSIMLLFAATIANAQFLPSIGIKAGLNFANVSNASSFNSSSETGFMVGGYLGGKRRLLSYRTELIFSRQGYEYKTGSSTGQVTLDYLLLPQLLTLNFGKYISLQAGGQLAFLLKGRVDSSGSSGDLMDFLNRFDYGIAAGAEFSPLSGLFIGLRYTRSLSDLYDSLSYSGGQIQFASPNLRNNVVQVYAGWRFGK